MKLASLLFLCSNIFIRNNHNILKIGHRGARGLVAENTLASFKKAIDSGADIIEFDVQCCKSGEPVVIHDKRVDRTTNGLGLISEKTLKELQELDAGNGKIIPTFKQALDCINRRAKVDIELKGPGVVKPVAQIMRDYILEKDWKATDFLVSSFNHYWLQEFCDEFPNDPPKQLPKISIGALHSGIPIGRAQFAENLDAHVAVMNHEFLDQAFVDDAHSRGIAVFAYTVNDPIDIERMKEIGVDGICSDYPDQL